MIERVGRALAKEEGYAYDPVPYDSRARVAIEAMREPTEAMLDELGDDGYNSVTIKRRYQAMIDTALE